MLVYLLILKSLNSKLIHASKNIGVWIRVSTDMQVQGDSPEHHEKRAKLYAEAKGWNVITVYRLDAMSGKSVMEYSETKRMLKDISDGTISGIIFSKLASLAGNTKEFLEISELFRESSADLISLAEAIDTSTPAGRLFFTVIAAMARWEREEIADRVAASVPIRAKMGKPLGGAGSFGYRWEGRELIVDEKEVPVRKLVYEIFSKIKRKKSTANELNKLGYRTRNGSQFTGTTIGRLLQDSTAKGIRVANYSKSLGDGRSWVLKPESEWVKIPCTPLFQKNYGMSVIKYWYNRKEKRIPLDRNPFTFYRAIYCGCGKKMYVYTEAPVYKCKLYKRKVEVFDNDEIYQEQLKSFLVNGSDTQTISQQSEDLVAEKEMLLKSLNAEYTKLQKNVEKWLELRVAGEFSKEDFSTVYKPVETQLRQIEEQLPQFEAERDFLKIQYLLTDTIIQDAKDLYGKWADLPFEEKRSIIETITDRITINNDTINISLSYLPTPHLSLNDGKRERNSSGSYWQLT